MKVYSPGGCYASIIGTIASIITFSVILVMLLQLDETNRESINRLLSSLIKSCYGGLNGARQCICIPHIGRAAGFFHLININIRSVAAQVDHSK